MPRYDYFRSSRELRLGRLTTLRRNNESGQALVFGVATLGILLIGIAGLGIDMGYLRYQKRLLQTAADSAAIAGASDLAFTGGSGVTPGAQDAAKINGFSDASGNDVGTCTADDPKSAALIGKICVQVNNPPLSGPHSSGANRGQYVEVYVSEVQPTFFMKALKTLSEPITARAVATTVGGGTASGCLYTLGSPADGIEGVNINGAATLTATTCGIVDDGNFNTKGNALTLNSGTFGIAGNSNKADLAERSHARVRRPVRRQQTCRPRQIRWRAWCPRLRNRRTRQAVRLR